MDTSRQNIHVQANEAARKNSVAELPTKAWADLKVPALRTVLSDLHKKVQTMREENETIVLDLRRNVEEREKECHKFRSDLQRIEIELNAREAEETKATDDIRVKTAELKGLASAQGDCKKMEEAYNDAKKNEDDYAATYEQKLATQRGHIKKCGEEIKVLSELITDDGNLLRYPLSPFPAPLISTAHMYIPHLTS